MKENTKEMRDKLHNKNFSIYDFAAFILIIEPLNESLSNPYIT